MQHSNFVPFLALGFLSACGDSGQTNTSFGGQNSASLSDPTPSSTSGTLPTSEGTASESQGSTTSDPSADSQTQTSTQLTQTTLDQTSTGDQIKLDVGAPETDTGGQRCDSYQFGYIWVANSNQGTISKINLTTLQEEGRYLTRPDGAGNPSRTSVNLDGDVVVANRYGGITKVAARLEDCPNSGNTSTGPNDIKPWPDGCVLWHTPMNYASQRPVAWTQGSYNDQTCRHEDTMVWTSGSDGVKMDVMLLKGDTGELDQKVQLLGVPIDNNLKFGLYGGAVDSQGNFWATQNGMNYMVKVGKDMSFNYWALPHIGYGMTVDQKDRVWSCSNYVARFDTVAEKWTGPVNTEVMGGAGCMVDAEGILWMAGDHIVGIDTEGLNILYKFPVPGGINDSNRGISIDFSGYIWSTSHQRNEIYRWDRKTGQHDTVTGLIFPYTYSDMIGFQLKSTVPG